MGVNCHITLPDNVRIDDVAKVIGILVGCKAEYEKFDSGNGGSTVVSGVQARTTSMPELAYITVTIPEGKPRLHPDGECRFSWFYHMESDTPGRCVSPGSYPLSQAVGVRLVQFFGGSVDFSDCDDVDVDYKRPWKSWEENHPSDGEAWERFQQRLLALKPLDEKEVARLVKKYRKGKTS